MKNMAGATPHMSLYMLSKELKEAKVPIHKTLIQGEVNSPVVGMMIFADGATVNFNREWYYWVVKTSVSVKQLDAERINKAFGMDIRVNGYSGGCAVSGPVSLWHVDTQEGLNFLSKFFKEIWGNPVNEDQLVSSIISGIHYAEETVNVCTVYLGEQKDAFHWSSINGSYIPIIEKTSYFQTLIEPKDKRKFIIQLFNVIQTREKNIESLIARKDFVYEYSSIVVLRKSDFFSSSILHSPPYNWMDLCFSNLTEYSDKDRIEFFKSFKDRYLKELEELDEIC